MPDTCNTVSMQLAVTTSKKGTTMCNTNNAFHVTGLMLNRKTGGRHIVVDLTKGQGPNAKAVMGKPDAHTMYAVMSPEFFNQALEDGYYVIDCEFCDGTPGAYANGCEMCGCGRCEANLAIDGVTLPAYTGPRQVEVR